MKAIQIGAFGDAGVLLLRDVPIPRIKDGDMLVRIHAASVNRADISVRRGDPHYVKADALPLIPGRDVSGVVTAVGDKVGHFHVGDEVFAVTTRNLEGCYAEFIALPAHLCARKPAVLSHIAAASLALTGLTAITALKTCARLSAGDVVFIHGGSGGVGSLAVQYAKSIGAHVIATSSPQNHGYMKALGADDVFDYRTINFTDYAHACDVVLDLIGGHVRSLSVGLVKPAGRLICVGGGIGDIAGQRTDIEIIRPNIARGGDKLEDIAMLAAEGVLQHPETRCFDLSDARSAHTLLESGAVRGKLVLAIADRSSKPDFHANHLD